MSTFFSIFFIEQLFSLIKIKFFAEGLGRRERRADRKWGVDSARNASKYEVNVSEFNSKMKK